ncbi:thioredoxin family protein [Saccharibacillus sp. CPCC 101409]|uniref:thioredoxin family protein n=1 Tax=Saccharibacillus sp. CPCC 101409 TaxID=3058041 RepID=UPI002673D3A9|nr:thioredoxin family protein [Saccharibacillus sp. CPCC 101409]MDO3412799.1 thioredoxin family protein [Saccharibacillus sp. CPCC 101409]
MGQLGTSNLKARFGSGLSPQGFIDAMQKNKEKFEAGYRDFEWSSEEDRGFFESLQGRDDLRAVILAADWCGDVVRNVPVVFRVLETADIPVDVLILEENFDLMDEYLTMGGRSVPVVILADTDGEPLVKWGPRPEKVQELMRKFKSENPDRSAADYEEKMAIVRMQMAGRYGEGTEIHPVIVHELRTLLAGV